MHNTYYNGHCNDCPLDPKNNIKHTGCGILREKYPVEYEKIIEDWTKKNPEITNGMKAKEIFGRDLNVYCYADAEFRSICDEHCAKCRYYKDAEYHAPEGKEKE